MKLWKFPSVTSLITELCEQFKEFGCEGYFTTVLGRVETSLDSTGTRCMESTMANMLTDAIRDFYDADVPLPFVFREPSVL